MERAGHSGNPVVASTPWPVAVRRCPMPPTSMLGRDAVITGVSALSRRRDVCLPTLLRAGGVGKARVTVAVTNRLAGADPGRLAFVALASGPDAVTLSVTQALGGAHRVRPPPSATGPLAMAPNIPRSAGTNLSRPRHLLTRRTQSMLPPEDDHEYPSLLACRSSPHPHAGLHRRRTAPYISDFDIESLERLLGGSPDEVPEAYADASPITWVDAVPPPFLVIQGGPADVVPAVHARTMVAALQQAGGAVISVELPAEDHFSIAEWPVAGPWASTFFAMVLHPER